MKTIYKLRTADLFAGIGGIRLGFESAGFKTSYASDFDPYCKRTYDLNFKDVPLFVEDIMKLDISAMPEFDVLLAGFPCQPFSIAGYRRGFEDKGRGNMFFRILKILRERKPKIIFLENVKNLRGHDGCRTFKVIKEALKDAGYYIKDDVLNSSEYGNVPQNRERIYIVGFLDKEASGRFEFPRKIKLSKSIKDILENEVPVDYYYDGKPLYKKLQNFVKAENIAYQWRRIYVRENKKGLCPTLTANMGTGGHNVPIVKDRNGIRKLTPRECARLQGFSDFYKIPLDIAVSRIYKQIGNSVTVPVVRRIALQIMKAIS